MRAVAEFRKNLLAGGLKAMFDLIGDIRSMDGPITASRIVSACIFSGVCLDSKVGLCAR